MIKLLFDKIMSVTIELEKYTKGLEKENKKLKNKIKKALKFVKDYECSEHKEYTPKDCEGCEITILLDLLKIKKL